MSGWTPRKGRVRPAPFQRPRVDLDGGVRRAWRDVPASSLNEGDVVIGLGLIHRIEVETENVRLFAGIPAVPHEVGHSVMLRAFTKAPASGA